MFRRTHVYCSRYTDRPSIEDLAAYLDQQVPLRQYVRHVISIYKKHMTSSDLDQMYRQCN